MRLIKQEMQVIMKMKLRSNDWKELFVKKRSKPFKCVKAF